MAVSQMRRHTYQDFRSLQEEPPLPALQTNTAQEFGSTSGHGSLPVEPTVLEYARFYGITKEYTCGDPLNPDQFPPAPLFLSEDLADPPGVHYLILPTNVTTSERLSVQDGALRLLQSACSMPGLPEEDDLFTSKLFKVRHLKVEQPILRSDNEMDMRNFMRHRAICLADIKLPLEHVDDEKDEGSSWPNRYHSLPAECERQIASDKLQVSQNILLYLQAALRDDLSFEYEKTIIDAESTSTRRQAIEPVTPPLLQMSPILEVFPDPRSSSPTCQLELLSENTNSTAVEASALEAELMKKDAITVHNDESALQDISDPMLLDEVNLDDIYSHLRSFAELPSSSPLKRTAASLKVEGPLTPPITLQSPFKKPKTVSFSEEVCKYIPTLPSEFENGEDLLGLDSSFEAFFKEQLEPRAGQADRELEQEQLQEVDTTRRVDVPIMDFTLPPAPWETYSRRTNQRHGRAESELGAQKQLISRCAKEELKIAPVWRGVSKLDTELHWSPFPPQLANVVFDEPVKDDVALAKMIEEIKSTEIIDSASLVWKPDGLRILDELREDEEELEPGVFHQGDDMESLVRKRKIQMLEEQAQSQTRTKMVGDFVLASSLMKQDQTVDDKAPQPQEVSIPKKPLESLPSQTVLGDYSVFGDMFSASSALSKFMEIHSGLVQPAKSSSASKAPITANLPSKALQESIIDAVPSQKKTAAPATAPSLGTSLPSPSIPGNLPPQPFIVSSALLSHHRGLVRHIKKLHPGADFIDRDFSSPTAPPWEADIIISPATGLLITSLQKIKQRALPGQVQVSGTKERVQRVSDRYERLFVLISEGKSEPVHDIGAVDTSEAEGTAAYHTLDERDCEALASLIGSTSCLETEISVSYVGGGEKELAQWVVGLMAQYGSASSPATTKQATANAEEAKLLQDETLWELFLRHAGLNAFAAQLILSCLKKPSEPLNPFDPAPATNPSSSSFDAPAPAEAESSADFGLAAFVRMPAAERARRFESLLGGTRVLRRVGRVLEQGWVSAADGFRGVGGCK